ncbi:MAG: hypothetical protein QME49_01615 [bacterium]|nr:hypothetical protein [bacterium]
MSNLPHIQLISAATWYPKTYNLGLILAEQSSDFDLDLLNPCTIKDIHLSASTAGLFRLTIYNKQARGIQDIEMQVDSSDMSQIITGIDIRYSDFDMRNKLYITINNASSIDMFFKLAVNYI